MPTPLLETKWYVAPLPLHTVPRPSLDERLNAGLHRKLTLVSAPAGSGKTTLVSAWMQHSDRPLAWLSLDDGDNDPARFFGYLLASLATLEDTIGQDIRGLLQASQSPNPELWASMLINDLSGTERPLVLVLDDYHTIHQLDIHAAVGLLLERQPPHVHLVITTRHDPPLPLSRLRGRGQMTEIRQNDLRFTHDEATAFLTRAMGLELTEAQIETLVERTEGWITGLQLAGLSMQGRDPEGIARFIEGFTGRHHFVLDYLTDEVLQRQPEPIQQFLLRTCILERLSGPLCDAVLDVADDEPASLQTLQHLDAINLFLLPLDDERTWYRYHHLFAELLRARLQETAPDAAPDLHRRAATWYETNDLGSDAVHHALATGDREWAADVIERQIKMMATWTRTDVSILLQWLRALPDDVVRRRPWLWLFTFRTMFSTGQIEESLRLLDELEDGLRANPSLPDSQRVLQLAAADRASFAATRGDVRQAVTFAQHYLAQVDEGDTVARIRGEATLGMAYYRSGDMARAEQAFERAIDHAQASDFIVAAVPFLCNLAAVQITCGHLRQARETCLRAMQRGTVGETRIAAAGFAGLVMAEILYEHNDLGAAERHLLDGRALLESGGIGDHFGNMHAALARVKQAQGDHEAAQQAIQWAMQLARASSNPRVVVRAAAQQARIWLAHGQLELATEWAHEYGELGETEYIREYEDLTLARVWLSGGRADRALQLLDDLRQSAAAAGRLGSVFEIQALRSVALQALGQRDRALDALESALTRARPEGYVRVFLDAGQPMRALLKLAASRGIEPGYVTRLLAAFDAPAGAVLAASAAAAADQPLVEPLSERQLEVLGWLQQGLTNKEIAQRLYISLPTVKSHTRSIYGKLGVHSRKEAVAKAEALGILPSD